MELALSKSVCLKDFESTGRGVAALRDIEEGEVLLVVELENCWTAERARKALGMDGRSLSEKEAILVHLMREAEKEDSEWSSHLRQLPTLESMGLPNFWADEDLEELEGSEVQTHAMRLKDELPEDFAELRRKLSRSEGLNFASYQWAWSIFASRAMSLSFQKGEEQKEQKEQGPQGSQGYQGSQSPGHGKLGALFAIVPGLDMFNHSPLMPPGLFKLEGRTVVVRAGTRLAAGEQAFINYVQPMFNSQMLQSFGFVLQDAELESSQITLSLQVTRSKLAVHRRLLDACTGANFDVLHTPAEESFEGAQELIVRHTLTQQDPLPRHFLGQVRAQHLPSRSPPRAREGAADAADVAGEAAACLDSLSSLEKEKGQGQVLEMRALLLVSQLLKAKLQNLCGSETEDQRTLSGLSGLSGPRRMALLQRGGERRVLQVACTEAERRQLSVIRGALASLTNAEGQCKQCPACKKAHTPWLHRLQAAASRLRDEISSVASLSKSLFDGLPPGHLLQACHLVNLWLVGSLGPCPEQRLRLEKTTWPWEGRRSPRTPTGPEEAEQPRPWECLCESSECSYVEIYVQKLRLWGSWLLSQWMHAEAVVLDELSSMGAEQRSLRQKFARSLPTTEALKALQRRAPLLEVGAGNGYWAALLKDLSVDILAFDSEGAEEGTYCEVFRGGPEAILEHPERTLVLMWPDEPDDRGQGSFGLQCLEHYQGQELILVGEWRTSTFGSYVPNIPQHGQSFSKEFQDKVEGEFCLAEIVELPRWPLFLDCLQVFRRR